MNGIDDGDVLRNRSIRQKFTFGVLAAVAALALTAAVSALHLDRLTDRQQAVAEQVQAGHAPLTEVRREYVGFLRTAGQFARAEQADVADEAAQVLQQYQRLDQDLKHYRGGTHDDAHRSQLPAEARLAISAASNTLEGVLGLLGAGQYDQARTLLRNGTDGLVSLLMVIDQRLAMGEIALGSAVSEVQTLEAQLMRRGWLFTLVLAALLLWLASGFSRSVLQPLDALRQRLNAMRSGNLDTPVPALERWDEVGEAARSLESLRLSWLVGLPHRRSAPLAGNGQPSMPAESADASASIDGEDASTLAPTPSESWRAVEGLDPAKGLARHAGQHGLYEEALREFLIAQCSTAQAMRGALDDRDMPRALQLADTFATQAEVIGASALAMLGRAMESALLKHDLTTARRTAALIADPLQRMIQALTMTVPAHTPQQ